MIYFVQGEVTRRIKIGLTKRFIHSRLGALQTGSPDKLIFLGARPGDERAEYKLHRQFEESHSHGEWFYETKELLTYISLNCIHDMGLAHSVDSLVSGGVELFEKLVKLSHEEINNLYMTNLVKKLNGHGR